MQSNVCDSAIAKFVPAMPMMNAAEALEKTQYVKDNLANSREVLLALWIRKGWKAMGYSSWQEYVDVELRPAMPELKPPSERHMYRLLAHSELVGKFTTDPGVRGNLPTPAIPERYTRELDRLPYDSDRKKVWEQAKQYNGILTTEVLRGLVDKWLDRLIPKGGGKKAKKKKKAPVPVVDPVQVSLDSAIEALELAAGHVADADLGEKAAPAIARIELAIADVKKLKAG